MRIMDWHVTTTVTHTGVTADGEHVVTLWQTSRKTASGHEFPGQWRGQVTNTSGHVMMTAEDASQGAVIAACQAWLHALSVARERDPAPTQR